ncbi:MAG TPA: sensor histidine kinase [Firmicutes bacterium]|nr:sensor histidine kinase [Bacillota bacterium]
MKDLSLYLLDLAQNSLRAGATLIKFHLNELVAEGRLVIEIEDNGKGMTSHEVQQVADPFYTTRTTRKVGLGLSLFAAAAKRCNGEFSISSQPGKGTKLTASFLLHHWDRPPLGDMAGTLIVLIAGNPNVDFIFCYQKDDNKYIFDTMKVKEQLEDVPIWNPTVLAYLEEDIRKGLSEIVRI